MGVQIAFCFVCKETDIPKPGIFQLLLLGTSPSTLGVVTTDFGGGGRFRLFETNSLTALPGSTPIHSDAIARFFEGKVYIVNRLGRDSIQRLNPNLNYLTEQEFTVGQNSNPQDIFVVSPNKSYISFFNGSQLGIYDHSVGVRLGSISLASFLESTSTSGIPDTSVEASTMIGYNGNVYLALQRLDRNDRSGLLPANNDSILIEIDSNTDRITNAFTLPFKNPFGRMQLSTWQNQPIIAISCVGQVGFLSQIDGGIIGFNLITKQFLPSPLYSEQSAGGDILAFSIASPEFGYASTLDSSFNKRIQVFQPGTGQNIGNLLEIPGSVGNSITGIMSYKGSRLLIGNTDFRNSGLTIYDINQGNRALLTPLPISMELTPSQILILQNQN